MEAAHCVAEYEDGRVVLRAKLRNFKDKLEILKNKKKLGRRPIFIEDDFTRIELEIQKKLRDWAKEERSKGKQVIIGYQKIYVDGVCRKLADKQ